MAGLPPEDNRAFVITLLGFAQLLTIPRIWIRHRSKRLWWDDAWAVLTTVISVGMSISATLFLKGSYESNRPKLVVKYWVLMLSFTIALWCARMSLILSIIRLIPPLFTLRRISEWAGVMFLCVCAGECISKIYVCASDRSWYHSPSVACHLGPKIAIVELVTDCVADVVLAAIPIQLLRGTSLPNDKRKMLIMMFAASLLISSISIVHVVFLMLSIFTLIGYTAEAEVGVAIIIANMCVLSPYVYRLLKKRGGDFDSEPYVYYHSFQENGDMRLRRVSNLQHSSALVSAFRFSPDLEMQDTSSKGMNISNGLNGVSMGSLHEVSKDSVPSNPVTWARP